MRTLVIVGLLSLSVVACDKKDDAAKPSASGASSSAAATPAKSKAAPSATVAEAPKPTAPAATSAAAAPAASAIPDSVLAAVPAEEDFEEKAAAAITPTNAEAELAKLDKEVGK